MALDLCKYYKKQEYVSYNNGLTWQPLENYEKGELYESHSSSCGAGVFQYQWVQINNGYICDGKDRYTREIYQYSEDGTVWYNVWPTQYRKGTLVESDSPFCDNAGNGQYSSGDTEPISGDTEDCPPNYVWNGYECECQGQLIGGECIACPPHSSWDGSQCVCERWWVMRNGVCVYVDPLKTIKCEDSDGILKHSDVNYYENGWAVLSYTIGDCIYRINSSAFNGQIYMHDVSIPSTVSEVGDYAFANCKNLESLTFPSSLEVLGIGAFTQCAKLKQVNFNGAIPSTLNNSLFSNCESLESATWLQYNNITSIGNRTFNNCYKLSNVVFPQTLTTVGVQAFRGCHSLATIEIPSGVTSIGNNAFEDCSGLTNVKIDSPTITIGNNVFTNCPSLTAVTIDSSSVTMGDNVFSGCTRLLKMTFTSPTPFQISTDFFDNTNECALFVPCGSLQAYKTAWSEYADRISCNDTGVYYRWIEDNVPYCDGTDEYKREKQQQTTNGITWTDTGAYRPSYLITHYSETCGYSDEVALAVTNEDGYTRYYEPCSQSTLKLIAVYNNGNYMAADCDSATTLTTATTKTYSTSYTAMTNAEIGNCITSIGTDAFYGCSSLRGIVMPNSVTSIGNQAFRGCTSLTSINIPSGVTSIGNSTFYQCTGLRSIDIPDSITSIGNEAFSRCSNLTSCTIGNSVTSIGYEAFYACYNLTSITINATTPPALVNTSAFNNTNNCPIYVPCESVEAYKSASDWSSYANRIQCIQPPFDGKFRAEYSDSTTYSAECDSSTSLTTATTRAHSTSYTAMTNAEIGNCVTSIGNSAFYYCTSLTSCTIGSGVTTISGSAFNGCSSLTSIVIPDSVTNIGDFAFNRCSGLTSIDIPSGVTSIGAAAFTSCYNLTSIDIPSGVTSIGNSTFQGCTSLTSIDIPNSVTSIGDGAFYLCTSLTSIVIPNGVTSIDNSAFRNCSGLTSITVNATTPPSLGLYVFDGTSNCPIYVPQASVNTYKAASGWSDYASRIQAMPWRGKWFATYSGGTTSSGACDSTTAITPGEITLRNLTKVEIGSCVTSTGDRVFSGCTTLTSVTIQDGVTIIDYEAFSGCTNLTSCTIGSGVTNIYGSAFFSCTSLTSVTIPDSVTTIAGNAFWNTGLKSVTIGSGITGIGNRAFGACTSLASVTVKATTPPTLDSNAFYYNNHRLSAIYVPAESVDRYKSASVWSSYANIIQAIT